ncbi:MAG: hypothetical protein WEA56_11380 [Balneolaceae bacterium]
MEWKELENESTSDLIEFMKMEDEYRKAAFFAFCFRFREELISKCEIVCYRRGFTADKAVELANRTFERFLRYPKYDHDKSPCDEIDKGVIIYLFGIAQRVIIDMMFGAESPYDGTEEILYGFTSLDNSLSGRKRKEIIAVRETIEKALSKLSEKHRIIFYTYFGHEEDGYKLPRPLLAALREKLDLSQDTVRFYKKQAFDKVKEYLEIYAEQ